MGIKHENHKYLLLLKSYHSALTSISCCPMTGNRLNCRLLLMPSEKTYYIWYYTKLFLEPSTQNHYILLSCSHYIWFRFLCLEPLAFWAERVPGGCESMGTLSTLLIRSGLVTLMRTQIMRAAGQSESWKIWKQINAIMFWTLKAI